MRILIYGAGVIGCELAHMLCKKNDVTILARAKWKDAIDKNGLVIRHYVQRKTTVDRLKTIDSLEPSDQYDLIFVVMQASQLPEVVPIIAKNASPHIVFVGNNMAAIFFVIYKTPIGRLSVSDHAMHAVEEMKYLDAGFEELRKKAGIPTPTWDSLRTDSRMEERMA